MASTAPTGFCRAYDIAEMILLDPRACVRMSIDILQLAAQLSPDLDPVSLAECQSRAKIAWRSHYSMSA
ncbi:hypothetical protein CDQ91_19025 [Sphingopyxis witflariensis]|uniref:Uncharacterized protein n=1 Tax=Sphingopyxis witflariensis TaxID=173675 RepID=A0A246JG89_9SPHN|nr:hypothetical protein CDQ91_19025 [Sphingopyxis witflariensis]